MISKVLGTCIDILPSPVLNYATKTSPALVKKATTDWVTVMKLSLLQSDLASTGSMQNTASFKCFMQEKKIWTKLKW